MRRTSLVALLVAPLLAVAPGSARAQDKALDDATIVAIYDAANTADMETGGLAVERATNKEVKDFGAMMVHDHQAVRQQGRDLAAKLGVTPTPPSNDQSAKDHAAAMTRLRALKGAAFDRAYMQHEVAYHQAVINAIKTTLLPAIKNAELKALVLRVAPAFEAHLARAQELEKKLSGGK